MSPRRFDELIKKEIVSNAALAKAVGLKADLNNKTNVRTNEGMGE